MMETLLSLPLYLVMLGGLFWLGERCLTRLTLTHGERLRLWEKGNWNSSYEQPAENIFHFLSPGTGSRPGTVTGYSGFNFEITQQTTCEAYKTDDNSEEEKKYGWGSQVSGHAEITIRRSLWSWGLDHFMLNNLWSGGKKWNIDGENAVTMYARTTSDGSSVDSLMLFRRGDGRREGKISYQASSTNGSNEWNKIYLGEWGDFIKPEKPTDRQDRLVDPSGPVDPYTRNSYYVRWSE